MTVLPPTPLFSTADRLSAGQKIPSQSLRLVVDGDFVDTTSDDQWGQGRHIIFGLPGAFTPTCSAKHLPGYVDRADALREKGIASIGCLAVHDAFVMQAWAAAQGCGDAVFMIADGNATLTQALGLGWDATSHGMGVRCQRCALVVNNGVIESVFIEEPGDFSVSAADHVLRAL